MGPKTRWRPAIAIAVATVALAPLAHGQVSAEQSAARRQLVDDAQAAAQRGEHARAIDLATRAGQIEMTPSLRLFLAQTAIAGGRFVLAMGHADLCIREATASATLTNRARIIEGCTQAQARARSSVGRVIVRLEDGAPADTRVTLNGTPVSSAMYGVASPVDAGEVRVEATAAGRTTFTQTVRVDAGQEQSVAVVLRPSTADTGNPSSGTGVVDGPTSGTQSPAVVRNGDARREPVVEPPTPSRAGPYALIGVGGALVAGAAVGAALWAVNSSAFDAQCQPVQSGARSCAPSAESTWNAVGWSGTLAWVSGSLGAATLAGGVAWLLIGRTPADRSRAMWVAPSLGQRPSIHVGGYF